MPSAATVTLRISHKTEFAGTIRRNQIIEVLDQQCKASQESAAIAANVEAASSSSCLYF
jgi:hypothetical protein